MADTTQVKDERRKVVLARHLDGYRVFDSTYQVCLSPSSDSPGYETEEDARRVCEREGWRVVEVTVFDCQQVKR